LVDKAYNRIISSKIVYLKAEILNIVAYFFRSSHIFVNLVSFAKKPVAVPGLSPGYSSRGGQKPEGGGQILKILYQMYAATRGSNVKWGA